MSMRRRWPWSPPRFPVRLILAFVLVMAVASVASTAVLSRYLQEAVRTEPLALINDRGDALAYALQREGARVRQLLDTVSQLRLLEPDRPDTADLDVEAAADRALRDILAVVRATDPDLRLAAVVDVATGEAVAGVLSREQLAPAGPLDLARDGLDVRGSQRVVPLREGGSALVHTVPVERVGGAPRLLVVGYPLDDERARAVARQTGVDAVELVVDGRVVAASDTAAAGRDPAGDLTVVDRAQILGDGRVLRYVTLGVDRGWDTPAVAGLIETSPLGGLGVLLVRVRVVNLLLVLVIGTGLTVVLARQLTRPLLDLADTATTIAWGGTDRGFPAGRGDELGQLAQALERMRRSLQHQVEVIGAQREALKASTRRTLRIRDEERRRLAQDLHDGIQQRLVLLRMQLGAVQAKVEAEPDRVRTHLLPLGESIDNLLDDLRTTGQALYPSILHDRGLGAALFSLAARSEVPVDVEVLPDPFPRLPEELEANAFFLVAEAVVNALKHADTPRIRVAVSAEPRRLSLRVSDDGCGFEPGRTAHVGGLVHLRDRVTALGGDLRLTTSPGQGTTVSAVLPVEAGGRRATDTVGDGPSVGRALQVEQDRGDPAVEVDVLGEPELAEDRVGVLLDGPLGDGQLTGDGSVAAARGHAREDLELPGRQPRQP